MKFKKKNGLQMLSVQFYGSRDQMLCPVFTMTTSGQFTHYRFTHISIIYNAIKTKVSLDMNTVLIIVKHNICFMKLRRQTGFLKDEDLRVFAKTKATTSKPKQNMKLMSFDV